MKTKQILISMILLAAFLLSACGGAATSDAMMEETEDVMMTKETPTADAMMPHETPTANAMMPKETATGEAMMESPAWFSAALTEVRTGAPFKIEDFKGKVVLVETMAVWCSSCLQQQGYVKILRETLGQRDDFVTIGLDIDPNEDTSRLQGFVDAQGFDWLYAVAPADVSRD
ncbi:MAG: hypothetical protein AB1649_20595, partial [Chloroflexota bacterium]